MTLLLSLKMIRESSVYYQFIIFHIWLFDYISSINTILNKRTDPRLPIVKITTMFCKKILTLAVLLLHLSAFAQNDLQLWYRSPAKKWTDAMPVGNGRLGAMVFGEIGR